MQELPAIPKEIVDSPPQTRRDQVNLTLQEVVDDVSKFEGLLPTIIAGLEQSVKTFKTGNLANFLSKWKSITTDKEIFDMITGTTIEFDYLPVQSMPQAIPDFTDREEQIIETEINKLLNKGVLVRVEREKGDFLSPIFLRDQKDGSHYLIAAEGSILIFTVFLWNPVLLAELYRVDVISIFGVIQGVQGGGLSFWKYLPNVCHSHMQD